jgi:hypothetical protein
MIIFIITIFIIIIVIISEPYDNYFDHKEACSIWYAKLRAEESSVLQSWSRAKFKVFVSCKTFDSLCIWSLFMMNESK